MSEEEEASLAMLAASVALASCCGCIPVVLPPNPAGGEDSEVGVLVDPSQHDVGTRRMVALAEAPGEELRELLGDIRLAVVVVVEAVVKPQAWLGVRDLDPGATCRLDGTPGPGARRVKVSSVHPIRTVAWETTRPQCTLHSRQQHSQGIPEDRLTYWSNPGIQNM
jgi:hypothetical protein